MERETRLPDLCDELGDDIETAAGQAREQALVVEHLPRVRAIVKRLVQRLPPLVDREELVHGGVLGLIDAARRYDATLGCSFATYSEIRIRGAVLDQLRALDWMPRAVRQRGRAFDRGYRAVEQREGRAAESEEVADLLGLTTERFEALRWLLRGAPLRRSDEPFDEANVPLSVSLLTPEDANVTDPLRALGVGRVRQAISDAIAALPQPERSVVSLIYWNDLSPEAVAQALDIALSRVRTLHVRALLRLRGRLRSFWE